MKLVISGVRLAPEEELVLKEFCAGVFEPKVFCPGVNMGVTGAGDGAAGWGAAPD